MTEPPGNSKRPPLRIGKYHILRHIASGGMASVYQARDVDLGRDVALKVLQPDLTTNPKMIERFRREAKAAAKLRHENIVAIYEFGEFEGMYFLALEFVDGIDLYEYIKEHGVLHPNQARELLKQAVKALGHVHHLGIIHRDIKPSNFLVTQKDGQLVLKLTDLGLARQAREDEGRVTRDGTTVGTVDYMSPEQANDSGSADIRSDIYSLGCTFYHMLAGHAPFPQGSLIEKLTKHINAEPPDIRQLNPLVGDDLQYVLDRMLRKRPAERYQTPVELLRDLLNPEQIVSDMPRLVPLEDPPPPPPPAKSEDRGSRIEDRGSRDRVARNDKSGAIEALDAEEIHDEPAEKPADKKRVSGKRLREEEVAQKTPRKIARKKALPRWLPLALLILGALALLLTLGYVAVSALLRELGDKKSSSPKGPDDSSKIARIPGTSSSAKKLPGKVPDSIEEGPDKKQPKKDPPKDEPGLQRIYPRDFQLDPAKLAEFVGPLQVLAGLNDKDHHITVSRLLPKSATTCGTLAEALALAAQKTTDNGGAPFVITVADNGPLFVTALPLVAGRYLVIRGAPGFRPLLAWDTASKKNQQDKALLTVADGTLVLDNLEFVVKWTEPQDKVKDEGRAAFVQLSDGDFIARRCTFSAAGQPPSGLLLARLDGVSRPTRCRLTDCYARGLQLTMLSVRGAGGDVQIDNCLLVGGAQALVEVACGDDSPKSLPLHLRVLHSTLVAGRHFLQLVPEKSAGKKPSEKGLAPPLVLHLLDSCLARNDRDSEGCLVYTAADLDPEAMRWQAMNVVYAGWYKLLCASNQSVRGTDLAGWKDLWRGDGERALADIWPKLPLIGVEELPAYSFSTRGSAVHFASILSPKEYLGSPLDHGERLAWANVTFEPWTLLPVPLLDGKMPAEIAPIKLEVNSKTDLGQMLSSLPANARAVYHLTGSGEVTTSPIVLNGAEIVLYYEPPTDPKAKRLTLVLNRVACDKKPALIEVNGGKLDLINVRIQLDNSKTAPMPQRLVWVKGGDLRLYHCLLEGPLDKAPDDWLGLIEFTGSGQVLANAAHQLVCQQSVLLSGKRVVDVRGAGVRVRLKDSVLLAANDVFDIAVGPWNQPRLNVQFWLDHNTFAARQDVFKIHDAPGVPLLVEPILVQADANFFADPFTESPRHSCLLHPLGDALARGLFAWQGTANAYDVQRWYTFAMIDDKTAPQPYTSWRQLWGTTGEKQGVRVEWPQPGATTFSVGTPQLSLLALPKALQGAGADLKKLPKK
jgi:serine/threonine-protein kinase